MKKTLRWIGLILLLLIIAGGITAYVLYRSFKMPVVTATFNRGYTHTGWKNAPLTTTLKIYNPNRMSVRLDSLTYAVEFDGKQYMTGKKDQPFEIKAEDTSEVSLSYSFDMKDFIKNLHGKDSALVQLHTVSYLHLWNNKNVRVPYTYSKNMPLIVDLDVKVNKVETEKLNLKELELKLNAGIYNPNALSILAKNFSYVITVDSDLVAKGNIPYSVTLQKKTTQDVSIPLKLDTRKMIAILTSKKEKAKNYILTMQTDVIVEDLPIYTNRYTFSTVGKVQELLDKIKKK